MRISKRRHFNLALAAVLLASVGLFQGYSQAAQSVFVDFLSDIGNGAGGGANLIPDWIDNLNTATTAAGVPAFTVLERAGIEAGIISQLQTMYSSFNVTFSTLPIVGTHERLTYGAFDPTPGSLGVAPLDLMNLFDNNGTEPRAARIFTNNFNFIIEAADPRATIITELTTALAGTGAHELGHSLGLQHHHAYGDPDISPANYANTLGIQNLHIMATGPTGLTEAGRETLRTFSQWEKFALECAGGAIAGLHGNTGTSLANTVLAETDSFTGPDVGNTTGTAKPLPLTDMPISGLAAANTLSTLFNDGDVDVYKFTVSNISRILADVWTNNFYADSFDSILRLFDTDGTSVLMTIDDTTFNGNQYNNGTLRSFDSSFLNVVLPGPGTYYLEVRSFGNRGGAAGGAYNLIFGVATIPEPSTMLMLAGGLIACGWLRRRA